MNSSYTGADYPGQQVDSRTNADGSTARSTEFGTAADERPYGSVDTGDNTTTVAGYTNGNVDGTHPSHCSPISTTTENCCGRRSSVTPARTRH